MTTQEAIRYLQRVVDFSALNDGSEAFEIALKALREKASREKPVPFRKDSEAAAD